MHPACGTVLDFRSPRHHSFYPYQLGSLERMPRAFDEVEVGVLFSQAKQGDSLACGKFVECAFVRLASLTLSLCKRKGAFDQEAIVTDVLADCWIKRAKFETWKEAWAYALKCTRLRMLAMRPRVPVTLFLSLSQRLRPKWWSPGVIHQAALTSKTRSRHSLRN